MPGTGERGSSRVAPAADTIRLCNGDTRTPNRGSTIDRRADPGHARNACGTCRPARATRFVVVSLGLLLTCAPALAQQDEGAPRPAESRPAESESRARTFGKFLGGAALGLGLHESSHIITSAAFGAGTGVRAVHFGPFPFFALTHDEVSPARELTISSAGFWAQHLGSEIILARRPRLRHEHRPLLKGVLAFNVLTSVAYAGAACARSGPPERDTRSMAVAGRVREPVVGALVLAPALLDWWRYARPEAAWAKWASRAVKIAGVALVARAVN